MPEGRDFHVILGALSTLNGETRASYARPGHEQHADFHGHHHSHDDGEDDHDHEHGEGDVEEEGGLSFRELESLFYFSFFVFGTNLLKG